MNQTRILFASTILCFLTSLDATAQDPLDDAKTYSEMVEKQERKRQLEQELIEKSTEDRDKRFGTLPDDTPEDLKQSYKARVDAFRESIRQLREIFTRYQISDEGAERDLQYVRQWSKAFDESQSNMTDWVKTMVDLYRSDTRKYNDLGLTLMEITRREGQLDRVEHVLESARVVLEFPPAELDAPLIESIGYIGYANCDFDLAQKAWDMYSQNASLPALKNAMYLNIENARKLWEAELEQRQLDQTKNNPIVELVTSKGIITVELFEDEAPESVANFLYLAKNKFYSKMRVFRVIPCFGAQSGCKIGNGTGNASYTIASETNLPNARPIFRGSLFFALSIKDGTQEMDLGTTSSQFMIASAALPKIDDSVTVFGRVISGIPKLGIFRKVDLSDEEQRKDPNNKTDFLVETNIIKVRDHEYVPTPVSGKLPF